MPENDRGCQRGTEGAREGWRVIYVEGQRVPEREVLEREGRGLERDGSYVEGRRMPERDGVVTWRDGGCRRGMEGAGEDRRVPERD